MGYLSKDAKLGQQGEESLLLSSSPIEKLLRFFENAAIYFSKDVAY